MPLEELIERQCDFCEEIVDDSEDLIPIYSGEIPQTRSVRLHVQAPRKEYSVGASVNGENRVLDYNFGELLAITKALKGSDAVDVDTKAAVLESDPGEIGEHGLKRKYPSFECNLNYDKIGVEIEIDTPNVKKTPDLMVCEMCDESVFGK